ncbi:predicted protein [Nematostella vectensis]|uniref:Protein C10 n=1 Tax=Nematostella vectensis TaxID=45351 RepID=A7SH80_NEMVE|nr:protein C10 [Nematostella vectensis]EDO36913.1 predicted protein [Nematostella vectensis]|eukprot:XP_001628976.1 predicted protein [Nematostella vectensis]
MAQKSRLPSLTSEQIKCILREVLSAFDEPENKVKMEVIFDSSGANLVALMHQLVPAAAAIQRNVIQAHGFPSSDEGVLRFTQMVNFFAKDDPEVETLANQLRTKFIPQMPVPPIFHPLVDVT